MSVERTSLYNETMPVINNHLDGPTIDQLVWAFNTINNEYYVEGAVSENYRKARDIVHWNNKDLLNRGMDNLSYDNFTTVIEAIERDGKKHFNMSVFFGRGSGLIGGRMDIEVHFNEAEKSFACNSVGCIAGYCTAFAVNWDEKRISLDNNHGPTLQIDAWKAIACRYLQIPIGVGENIFFADERSVWSYLKAYDYNFCDLVSNADYDDDHQFGHNSIELNSITSSIAVQVLTMIRDKKIIFVDDDDPAFNNYEPSTY